MGAAGGWGGEDLGCAVGKTSASRVDVEAFAHDARRARPQLDRLDPPQDQLGIGLADGEGTHATARIGRNAAGN
jgi:hypothetical protein